MSKLLSALVLAGGSSGVNSVLVSLGFRSVRTAETIQQKPPPDKAWLAVEVTRTPRKGDQPAVDVLLESIANNVASGPQLLTRLKHTRWPVIGRLPFIRGTGRFPAWGGHPLEPGVTYKVYIQQAPAQVPQGQQAPAQVPQGQQAPDLILLAEFKPAKGAIIDVNGTL
jgi:hypothetical protein